MAETIYTGQLAADQQGDIILDPRTRLGRVGTIETTGAEVTEGVDLVTVTVQPDGLTVNVKTTGMAGNAVVMVTADKNKDPEVADNEVGIFNILITEAGTVAVPMTFGNIRPVEA